jgi:hypothetical protein
MTDVTVVKAHGFEFAAVDDHGRSEVEIEAEG